MYIQWNDIQWRKTNQRTVHLCPNCCDFSVQGGNAYFATRILRLLWVQKDFSAYSRKVLAAWNESGY